AMEASAEGVNRRGNQKAARAGRAGNAAELVRSGGAGAGLRVGIAAGRVKKSAAGTTASRSGVHQRHRQGKQGTRGAGGENSGGGIKSLPRSRPAETGHAQ